MVFLCGCMLLLGDGLGTAMSATPIEEAMAPVFCRLATNPVGNECIGRLCLFGGTCGTIWNGQAIYCDCP